MPEKSFVQDGLTARRTAMKGLLRVCLFVVPVGLLVPGAAGDKKHQDAFTSGDPTETRISKQVRHELLMLPYYGVFDDLAFRVDGSTVALLGAVTRPTLKSDAENVVKKVEGVTRVINEIEVLPLSPMDDQIRRAVFRAIFSDPTLSIKYGYGAVPSIHIIVKNGNVRLEGVVDSDTDKQLAYMRANGVPNVFSVVNDLQVVKS
jgi:hyperosmotically inducible periplasmic protein